jgi:VWFA-related protein
VRRIVLFTLLTLLAAVSGPLASSGPDAQQPTSSPRQPAPASQPPIRVETNYVRVDVYPTRGGRPVHGLKREDFELLEDGVPQRIEAFEHVVIQPAGPQAARVEPSSVREAEQAAANPRNRVFVIYLDVPHVSIASGHHIKEPLISLMDRMMGEDDLMAVMTPEMSPDQLTFGRKTEVIARGLRENWPWGIRDSVRPLDEREDEYRACYPPMAGESHTSAVAERMIERRRERMVLESLHDLVAYLGGIREERKAIVTITEGWRLLDRDPSLLALRKDPITGQSEPVPGLDPIGVGPTGKLTHEDHRRRINGPMSKYSCDTERMALAEMDNERYFRDLLGSANRANASFYPIDPRGLPVFDDSIGPDAPLPPVVSQAILKHKIEILRTLAENTDGVAVVNTNDLQGAVRRISDDLTSYYLLGYYSTNAKLDGRFRSIKVRVKGPDIEVRARRGYRAATAEEVSAARGASAAPGAPDAAPVASAIGSLARIRPEARFHLHAAPVANADGHVTGIWVAGELQPGLSDFAKGGEAIVQIGGGATGTAQVTLKAGERAFLTLVPVQNASAAEIDVRARATSPGAVLPLTDVIHVTAPKGLGTPLLFRRGLSPGNRQQPAADFRFSRTERLHLEIAIGSEWKPARGRLLDRNGQPLQVPVTVGERTDAATGQRWLTGDLILAPLAPGDYALEVAATGPSGEQRVVTGIRVTR